MADLYDSFWRLAVRGAHALGVIEREGQRLFLIDMLARFERIDKMLAMQMLRRGDDDGVDGLVLQKPAMIAVGGRGWDAVSGVVQALGVDIGECGDLDVGTGQSLVQEFAAALSSADQADADAIVRTQQTT